MGIRVRLEHVVDGQPRPFRLARAAPPRAGVVREGEVGAPPRRVRIDLNAFDALARNGVARHVGALLARADVDDGDLVLGPDPPDRIPRGTYELLVLIDDLVVAERRRVHVKVDAAGDARVVLRVVPRRIELERPVDAFDPVLSAFLRDGPARIDGGQTLAAWLASELPQPKRRALLMNVLAMLRGLSVVDGRPLHGHPGEPPSLLTLVRRVVEVEADHMLALVSPGLRGALREIHAAPVGTVYEDVLVHASHRRSIEAVAPQHGLTPGHIAFESFRTTGAPSMQIIVGRPNDEPPLPTRDHLADLDLDLANPLQDVAGIVVHVGELFDEGLDHVRLRGRLAGTAAAPFLYYHAA